MQEIENPEYQFIVRECIIFIHMFELLTLWMVVTGSQKAMLTTRMKIKSSRESNTRIRLSPLPQI
ncbi:hypothetical protein Hanom_Chr09g00764431 [Helianthus anomalus]